MTYQIQITESLIKSTVREFTSDGEFMDGCPFEEAIRTQTDLAVTVCNDGRITVWGPHWDKTFDIKITYARALDFIKRWRSKKTVKPFDFTFQIP